VAPLVGGDGHRAARRVVGCLVAIERTGRIAVDDGGLVGLLRAYAWRARAL
jgi:hypothetical protein